MRKKTYSILLASCLVTASYGATLDLSGWSPVTLDFPGGQGVANWEVQSGNESVIQTANSDPSFFLNNVEQSNFSIDGSWRVNTGSDDDYMGFVFGYQDSSNFYLFDWKQGSQSYSGASAAEGMTVKKVTGETGDGLVDLSLGELWENQVDFGDMEVLATNHGSGKGWASDTLYDFHLDFNLVPDQFSIRVNDGAEELWNVTLEDSAFSSGQFGFYNYSQSLVEYNGFEQTDGPPPSDGVPDPVSPPSSVPDSGSTLAVLSIAVAGLALARRRA